MIAAPLMTASTLEPRCDHCSAVLARTMYEVRGPGEVLLRCLRCAVRYRPLMKRSLVIALIVGTILTLINQGNVVASGDVPSALAWKVPLTYCVPYCVATTGAILNGRRSRLPVPV